MIVFCIAKLCDMATDLTDTIETEAKSPQSVTADGVSIGRRSVKDLIEADRYLANKDAASNSTNVVKSLFSQIVPPGGH